MAAPVTRFHAIRFVFLASLLALGILAAVWSGPSPQVEAQPGTAVARAEAYLSQNADAMGLRTDLRDLRLEGGSTSLTADHVRYQQTISGVPVFGATVSVSLPKNGGKTAWTLNRYAASALDPAIVAPIVPARAVANAEADIGVAQAQEMAPPELVYYPTAEKEFVLAWKLTLRTLEPFGDWLVVIDAGSGERLLRMSLLRYDDGRVFDPNPAVTNGGTAPAPDCDGPAKQALLAGQYRTRTLQGIDGGQGKLKGDFVDLTAPGISGAYMPAGLADEASHSYVYGCNDDRFEEVMTYYHIDVTQRKMQSLGFTGPTGIIERPIAAHAHYMPGCNAFYSPADRGVHFGDFDAPSDCGSTPSSDSGEDADVIVHEYGHAIQDDQVPGWGQSVPPFIEQPGAIGEGFGDFLAGVINGDPCIGEYVNFGLTECNGSPGLRYMQNNMTYPAGFESCPDVDMDGDTVPDSEEVHCGGLLWGGALWDLVEQISGGAGAVTQAGRDLALRLVLESHFFLDQEATFNEAAAAICYADSLLYGGSHQATIGSVFAGRGINSGACMPSDFESVYIRIPHQYSGDLDISVLVGPNKNSPLCEINITDPNPLLFIPDWYVGFVGPAPCAAFMPPTTAQPWWLEARDDEPEDTGTIAEFQVLLAGATRCVATDTPIAIPDNGPAVYSKLDCTSQMGGTPAPVTQTPTPPPGGGGLAGDVDCSGGVNSVDSLKILRYVAALSVAQTEPCTDVGVGISGLAPQMHGGQHLQGDVDCNGSANSVDSLKILRYVAGMSNNLPSGCPAIGTPTGGGGTATPTPVATPTHTPVATPTPTPSSPTPTFDPSLTECAGFGAGAAIPDNSSSGIVGTINVPESGDLMDMDVCVNANHPRPNDLQFRLRHVDTGTEVVLFDGTSCAIPNVRLYFDDAAGSNSICPLDGTVRPLEALSAFDGENVHGTWELTFADVVSGQTGTALGVTIYYEYTN